MRSGGGVYRFRLCQSDEKYTAAAPTLASKHDKLKPARKQLLRVHSAVVKVIPSEKACTRAPLVVPVHLG